MFTNQTKEAFVKVANSIKECNNVLLKISDSVNTLDKFGYDIPTREYISKMCEIQKILSQLEELNKDTYDMIFGDW